MALPTKAISAVFSSLWLTLAASAAGAEVVVVVSAENPIESLSRAQLTDIYLGRLSQFPTGDAVVPIDQREGSPAHDEFYSQYLQRTPAQVKAHWSKLIFTGRGRPPRAVSGDDATAGLVADNPNAIGYLEDEFVDDRLRIVAIE